MNSPGSDAVLISIEGIPSSEEILTELAAEKKPVLLGFSRGKDSICAWLALREYGIPVVPYHLYAVPGLRFIADSLRMYEDFFGQHIYDLPHPSLYRWLINYTFCPPERWRVIDAAGLPEITYADVAEVLRADLNLPDDCWNTDGVRAADSPMRRMAMSTHGPKREQARKVSVIWDWQIADIRSALARHSAPLPIDYEWFGRSFDGLDRRFIEPLHRHAPEDYAQVLSWFPLAELEMMRFDLSR